MALLDEHAPQVEAADMMDGFLLLQSMAGGTGAGFGTYVAQALRDEYGSANMMNCCVWPYDSGEVSVQSYNTILTLSYLAESSDGIVLMANDALHKTCVKLHNIQRPGFADMNAVVAQALAGFLLPTHHRPLGGSNPHRQQHSPFSPAAAVGALPRSPAHAMPHLFHGLLANVCCVVQCHCHML